MPASWQERARGARWSSDVVERLQWKSAADGTPLINLDRDRRS